MTDWIHSVVLIIPASHKDAGNALGEAMGWGPNSYAVPLSGDGTAPASHYGCRAIVRQDFIDLLANPSQEAMDAGAGDILAVLLSDVRTGADGLEHFTSVCDANGLKPVE